MVCCGSVIRVNMIDTLAIAIPTHQRCLNLAETLFSISEHKGWGHHSDARDVVT
jgi:hypothetical protein